MNPQLITDIFADLGQERKITFRKSLHVLCPPIDAPRFSDVFSGVVLSVREFKKTLIAANPTFNQLELDLINLVGDIQEVTVDISSPLTHPCSPLDQPLLRRLSRYPAWGMFLELARMPEIGLVLEAAGCEFTYSIMTGKPFAKGFAKTLRRIATNVFVKKENLQDVLQKCDSNFINHLKKIRRETSVIFDLSASLDDRIETFEDQAYRFLRRIKIYSTPRHRQGILDHACQSKLQVLLSAKVLLEEAHAGDQSAICIILSFLAGLSPEVVLRLPLAGSAVDDWFMILDIEEGVIKTNISSLVPDSATPTAKNPQPFCGANKIVVKPVPMFIASILRGTLDSNRTARVLGDLLPSASVTGRNLTIDDARSAIIPSTKRFLNSSGPFALQVGLNRMCASVITNDFSLVPSSKFYYALVERQEIWDASKMYFEALGWGPPVEFVDGLPVGSAVTPDLQALLNLYLWMKSQAEGSTPGKRYTFNSLKAHHFEYAHYCASFTSIMLVSRHAAELGYTAYSLGPESTFTVISDKRVGLFPGPVSIPINIVLRYQLQLWYVHCRALNVRLEKLGYSNNSKLRNYLNRIDNREPVQLFFRINEKTAIPLGTSDLTNWWPKALRFKGDSGRHLWERVLHERGVKSSAIDAFMRHQSLGVESFTTTTNVSYLDVFQRISRVQESVLAEWGIRAIAGLSLRKRST